MKESNPIQVAGRLFDVLEYLARHGQTSLQELTIQLGMNKSTIHRLLSSLEYMGYVRQDPSSGYYEASYKIVELSTQVMSHVHIASVVRPYLQKLSDQVGETVHFVERDGNEVIYIDKLESAQNSLRMVSQIGRRMPFYRSAVGKAISASMSEDQVKALWNESDIERATPYTITDFDEFLEVLEEVRRRGYALDNEENETGVRCIGAAVSLPAEAHRYAFSISAPLSRMDNSRIRELAEYVLETKQTLENLFRQK